MTLRLFSANGPRRKAVWGPRRTAGIVAAMFALALIPASAFAGKVKPGDPHVRNYRIDDELQARQKQNPNNRTRVIVELKPGAKLPKDLEQFVVPNGELPLINGLVLLVPNGQLEKLDKGEIFRAHYDRPTGAHNYRTAMTTGARMAQMMGVKGDGVGIAVLDSGITPWHDDLTNNTTKLYPYGNQRVAKFVDFVNGRTLPYDDNGHGTHVAGILAGNGKDSLGEKAGMAPNASLVVLKVLDANGRGTISNIIAALSWIAQNAKTYNIRVVNMSVGAGVHESYWTDPLTLAAKAITDRGIVVVAAAGNLGKNASGQLQWGGITAPGNAPWVLTVGASSTNGTIGRSDDEMASFSSSGPTYIDYNAKPDLVAPGAGTISLAAPGSLLYSLKLSSLVDGKLLLGTKPYLTLSGTSMAAPVVAGTVAQMFQVNPKLTPNLVKAILQYTAQSYGYNPLRQGAGFLDSFSAVYLASFYAKAQAGAHVYLPASWSKKIIWGNHMISGGFLQPSANAWSVSTVWGAGRTMADDNIVWGTMDDNIVWGTMMDDNIVWGTMDDNIVWGTMGKDDNIVWGTGDDDNIVWGTDCGGANCSNVVWGTMDDNIVWGTAAADDNIVWGTMDDNIVWGTNDDDNIVWGTSGEDELQFPDDSAGDTGQYEIPVDLGAVSGSLLDGGL